jgi:hypothetical protein
MSKITQLTEERKTVTLVVRYFILVELIVHGRFVQKFVVHGEKM